MKRHEAFTTNPSIYDYINKINNRAVFKIKDGYMLELQMPETMKLFASPKKFIGKNKKCRKYVKS